MCAQAACSPAPAGRSPSGAIACRRPPGLARTAQWLGLLYLVAAPLQSAANDAPRHEAWTVIASPEESVGTTSAWQRTGDPIAGAEAYEACAACHGEDGGGRADGTFPRIAGQHASVLAKQLSDIIDGRRGNPIMTSHLSTLTNPQEMADLAEYIETMPGPPADAKEPVVDVRGGRVLYAQDCALCHGERGQGDSVAFVPVIAGQHPAYVLRQLRAIAGSLRYNAHPEMVDTIVDYRDEQLSAVAAYVASLPWPARTGSPLK